MGLAATSRNVLLYFRRNSQSAVVLLFGLLLVIVGVILWQYYLRISTVMISVGTSLIAAAFITYLSPQTQEVFHRFLNLGISDVYLSRTEIDNKKWVDWIRSARRHCTLFGITNNKWCGDPGFKPALLDLVQREVTVKIFFLDPNSDVARERAKEEKPAVVRDTIQTTKESIEFVWDLRQEIDEKLRPNLQLYVYNATPSFGATWVDSFMIATHYLAGFPNVTSPALLIKPVQAAGGSKDLYGIYDENIRNIEKHHATPIDENNVANYIPAASV